MQRYCPSPGPVSSGPFRAVQSGEKADRVRLPDGVDAERGARVIAVDDPHRRRIGDGRDRRLVDADLIGHEALIARIGGAGKRPVKEKPPETCASGGIGMLTCSSYSTWRRGGQAGPYAELIAMFSGEKRATKQG